MAKSLVKSCNIRLDLRVFSFVALVATIASCTTYEYNGKEFSTQDEMILYRNAEQRKQEEQNRKTAALSAVRQRSGFPKCACTTRKLSSFSYGATCSSSLQNRSDGAIIAPVVTFAYLVTMFGDTSQAYIQPVAFPETTVKAGSTVTLTKDVDDQGILWQVTSAMQLGQLTPLGGGNQGRWQCSITDVQI